MSIRPSTRWAMWTTRMRQPFPCYHWRMTTIDPSRLDATSDDTEYSLSIDDAADRYAHAGHPRTPRSIQRYCAHDDLDCRKIETTYGSRYLIAAYSVARHIAQIEEVTQATGRAGSRPVAKAVAQVSSHDVVGQPTTGHDTLEGEMRPVPLPSHASANPIGSDGPDLSRPDATVSRFVDQLESDNEFLRDQIVVKDGQIRELTERAKETNHLIAGLQRMLTPLLGSGRGPREQREGPVEPGDNSTIRDA